MRTTVEEVKAILDGTTLTDDVITSYITSASAMVNNLLINKNLTATILKEIERWLTAHMIVSTRERQAKRQEAGSAKIEYFGRAGLGLDSTTYGQMVKSLDSTGILASSDMKAAEFFTVKQVD